MPIEPKPSSVSRAVRPWVLGALFIWTLTGAVAFAAYSSRDTAAPTVSPDAASSETASSEVAAPQSEHLFTAPAPIVAASAGQGEVKNGKGIRWETDFDAAMRRARVENKPIMIDFYTDWCSVCKMLDREVLPQPTVISESRNWVAIRINAEKRPDVAGAYGVTGYPTLVFAEKSGKPLSILPGFAPAPEFVTIMKEARGKLEKGGEKITVQIPEYQAQ